MLSFRCLLHIKKEIEHTNLDLWECIRIGSQWGWVGAEVGRTWCVCVCVCLFVLTMVFEGKIFRGHRVTGDVQMKDKHGS